MVTTVKNKRESVITWDQYETPKDSALGNPYLTGKIECYVNQIGPANGRIKFDLVKIEPKFMSLSDHGKHCLAHGVKQKAVDGCGNKSASEVYRIVRATRDRLEAQQWNATRESAVARKMQMLATDMAVTKFTLKFTKENLAECLAMVTDPENVENGNIEEWLNGSSSTALAIDSARQNRIAREFDDERKLAAEKLKTAGKVELTF